MEYGEAINANSFERALEFAHGLRVASPEMSLKQVAHQAVGHCYCTCVTEGEDAAEHRFSDVHRRLIEELALSLQTSLGGQRSPSFRWRTGTADSAPAGGDLQRRDQ